MHFRRPLLQLLTFIAITAGCLAPVAAAKTRSVATTTAKTSPVTITSTTSTTALPTTSSGAARQYFASTSVWYQPLAADAPLDARSATWAQKMVDKVNTYGKWINTTSYSTPVYTVGPSQPLVPV